MKDICQTPEKDHEEEEERIAICGNFIIIIIADS
jgi:hypothetical protein